MTKNLSDIDKTKRSLNDITQDIEKWERIHLQLLKIEDIEVIKYRVHEKILDLESIQFILKSHLRKMGGR